jgi:hypothetical protein
MDMVLYCSKIDKNSNITQINENSTEMRRVNTYEQVESGRGYRK